MPIPRLLIVLYVLALCSLLYGVENQPEDAPVGVPNFDTADRILQIPVGKARVVRKSPCAAYLEADGNRGFYIGSPSSDTEVALFVEGLQEGQTYMLPQAFEEFRTSMIRDITGPVSGVGWPQAVARLANHKRRFHAKELVPCLESTFYYSGRAADFNAFLAEAAESPDVILVVHPGSKLVSPDDHPEFRRPADWTMEVDREPSTFSGGVFGIGLHERTAMPAVVMHLWLGGRVQWDEVEVPQQIHVQSSGELEDFISRHNAASSMCR